MPPRPHVTRILAVLCIIPFCGTVSSGQRAVFDAPVVTLGPFDGQFECVLDWNGDGFKDAVSLSRTAFPQWGLQRIDAWRNNLAGRLVFNSTVNTSSCWSCQLPGESSIKTGFLNGDNYEDFVYWSGSVALAFLGGPSAPTAPTGVFNEPALIRGLVISDFDGDGREDLAVGQPSLGSTGVAIHYFTGTALVTNSFPGLVSASAKIVAAEVNGDGLPDLIAETTQGLILLPFVGGVPTTGAAFSLVGLTHRRTAAGDVDGDGDEDLTVFANEGYVILRRTSATTFVQEPLVAGGGPAAQLVDMDGDGDLDGVCCSGIISPPNNLLSRFRISINQGGGQFAPAFDVASLGARFLAGVADLDQDGQQDLVAGRVVWRPSAPLSTSVSWTGTSTEQIVRSFADLDGDGDPDRDPGLDTVRWNRGDGTLTPVAPPLASAPGGTTFQGPGYHGDIDGDGDLDLIVEHRSGQALLSMRILRNLGGGSFVDAGPAGPAGSAFSPPGGGFGGLIGDVDADGDQDILATGSGQTNVWLNDGSGFFTSAQTMSGIAKIVKDLTGDGVPDLLMAGAGMVFRSGNGGGNFGAAVTATPFSFTTNAEDVQFDLVDFDQDGLPDVVAPLGGSALVFAGNGTGLFSGGTVLSNLDLGIQRVLVGDVDDDGHADILMSPVRDAANSTRILFGPSFSSGTTQTTIVSSLVDVDGDGDLDSASDVIISNRTHRGVSAGARRQYGDGLAGSGGLTPVLGATGPFRAGEALALLARNGRGGAPAVLIAGLGPSNTQLLGGTQLATSDLLILPLVLWGQAGQAGTGWIRFDAAPLPAGLTGTQIFFQLGVVDAAAQQGIALSNGLDLLIGQ